MQGDRVQRILDLMRHVTADAADGGEARADIDLRGHLLEQLIQVVTQLAGTLLCAAELLTQQVQLGLHHPKFLGGFDRGRSAIIALRDAVDGLFDALDRAQHAIGGEHGEHNRKQ